MADQTIPDYETISAAVTGETWAVEKVLMCYKDEIDRQATVKKRQLFGWDTEAAGKEYSEFLHQFLAALKPELEKLGISPTPRLTFAEEILIK